jgi:hypothetical protein
METKYNQIVPFWRNENFPTADVLDKKIPDCTPLTSPNTEPCTVCRTRAESNCPLGYLPVRRGAAGELIIPVALRVPSVQ